MSMGMPHCPLCGAATDARLLAQSATLRPAIARWIQQQAVDWVPAHGLCPTCALQHTQLWSTTRSSSVLHIAGEPPTTFPYYHTDYHSGEETVLSQSERLPDYHTITGQGVTLAFLDSGYYPHPDLSVNPTNGLPSDPYALTTRISQYVDLWDGGECIGVDQPSLWDGAGLSWHGQMTTVLAAGNGGLSGGRYRGYAPQANILPIKVGRRGGRIPEEDILRGLQWLLQNDNWARYGVRVLNISVGGDFVQPWQENPLCLAAEELAARGVLICAAAGNSNRAELLALASAPSVLTVGGYDDQNQRWRNQPWRPVGKSDQPANSKRLRRQQQGQASESMLYPHNYSLVNTHAGSSLRPWHKPELLALARWLPSPILPPSPVLPETVALHELRTILQGYDELQLPTVPRALEQRTLPFMPEVWQAVRQRMNAHKWVHPYYQHVDGTSVAVAQVSAVATQMFAANPQLHATQARDLLLKSAYPLLHEAAEKAGHGLLQPSQAVALALRAAGGPLVGYPLSGTVLTASELQKWLDQGTVTLAEMLNEYNGVGGLGKWVYFGHYALEMEAVSLIGSFNAWQPDHFPLRRASNGWWHGLLWLPGGNHCYRFWCEHEQEPAMWQPDPENPLRCEGGYRTDHSLIQL